MNDEFVNTLFTIYRASFIVWQIDCNRGYLVNTQQNISHNYDDPFKN